MERGNNQRWGTRRVLATVNHKTAAHNGGIGGIYKSLQYQMARMSSPSPVWSERNLGWAKSSQAAAAWRWTAVRFVGTRGVLTGAVCLSNRITWLCMSA